MLFAFYRTIAALTFLMALVLLFQVFKVGNDYHNIKPNMRNKINEIPSKTNEQPSKTNEQLSKTNGIPSKTNGQPSKTNEQLSKTNGQPSKTVEQPNELPNPNQPLGKETQLQYRRRLHNEVKNIAAVSVSIPNTTNPHTWHYVFYLPLTAESWLRLGYEVAIFIAVDFNGITEGAKKIFESVIDALRDLPSVSVFYIDVRSNLKIRLSQISRIYAAHLGNYNKDSFIVLSDSDLWPIQKSRLDVNASHTMLITNSLCCGTFLWKEKRYRQFPMAHIGMKVSEWLKLFPLTFNTIGTVPEKLQNFSLLIPSGPFKNYFNEQNLQPLFDIMVKMFGNGFYTEARHGGPLWSIDQIHVSLTIGKYRVDNGDSKIKFVPRWECLRVDRSAWVKSFNKTKCKADAHLLHGKVWGKHLWGLLMLLMKTMFDDDTIGYFEGYRLKFSDIIEPH